MPNKVKKTSKFNFFRSIPASIYSPTLYAGMKDRSFWSAFGFLAGINVLILLAIIAVALGAFFLHRDEIDAFVQKGIDIYPDELVLTMQDEQLSTNVTEPYFVTASEDLFDENAAVSGDSPSESVNLAVFDTQNAFTVAQYEQYHAFIWFGKDFVAAQSEDQVRFYPYKDVPDGVMTKAIFESGVQQIWTNIQAPFLAGFSAIFLIFGFIGLMMWRLFYNLFLALCIWGMGNMLGIPYSYDTAYKTGLYAMTLPSLLTMILIFVPFHAFPLFFTLLSLSVAGVSLNEAKKQNLLKAR